MELARTCGELAGLGVRGGVFVPTMGALHEGHASLIRRARERAVADGRSVVVSVFVNPTQFNEPTDFERYPRALEADASICEGLGVDAVFAPEAGEVYPAAGEVAIGRLPSVATDPGLEDAHRPGHFAGVCQVVRRLFEMVPPAASVFGEKDWQQLQVIRAMVAGEGLPVEVIAGPTVREADGVAMSSRNRLLGPEARRAAAAIPRALLAAGAERSASRAEAVLRAGLEGAGLGVEYAVVRDAETLMGHAAERPGRALVAVRAGVVRLIDNTAWPPGAGSDG